MKALRIAPALAAAALIVLPSFAMAEGDQNSQNRTWQNGRWQQQNGQYNNGQYQNGRRRHRDDDDNNNNNNGRYGNNGYGNRNGNQLGGQVSSFSPFNLYLSNGTHVELHQGTVISPNGATPQPGQRAQIYGHWNSDGSFAADQITLR